MTKEGFIKVADGCVECIMNGYVKKKDIGFFIDKMGYSISTPKFNINTFRSYILERTR